MSKTNTPTKSLPKDEDAIELLMADHKEVKAMFKQFESLKQQDNADDDKAELVGRICAALTIHATVEEEIFYPAVREAIDDEDLMDEADVEHEGAKDLIAKIQASAPGEDHFDAKVTVLGEYIKHHVEEEQSEMFPKVRKAELELNELGSEMSARKAELQAELA